MKISMTMIAFFATAALADLTISGRVLNNDSTPKEGVVITHARTQTSATTDESGNWLITAPTSTSINSFGKNNTRKSISGHLFVENGRIKIEYNGKDISSRINSIKQSKSEIFHAAARIGYSDIDTLIFSYRGVPFLRDTLSVSRQNIIRLYDTTWNPRIIFGWLTDSRDSKVYRTVKIQNQFWIAQNLNYTSSGTIGSCKNGSYDSCQRYGRLYTWTEALDIGKEFNTSKWGKGSQAKGVCPSGWRIPSANDWLFLLDTTLDSSTAIRDLKALRGRLVNGSDAYGFRLIFPSNFSADYWSSSEVDDYSAKMFSLVDASQWHVMNLMKSSPYYIRCIRENQIPKDSTLASLSTSKGKISPQFSSDIFSYTDTVKYLDSVVILSGIPSDSESTVLYSVNGGDYSSSGRLSIKDYFNNIATIKVVNINGNEQIYSISIYRPGIPWNENISYGKLTDPRDGQIYRTVSIGAQTWVAENLNYSNNNTLGKCYNAENLNCEKFGRMYDWYEMMDYSTKVMDSAYLPEYPSRGICPIGWHVPSRSDWHVLSTSAMDSTSAGFQLSSVYGWPSNYGLSAVVTDAFGFRALPTVTEAGPISFWASTEPDGHNGYYTDVFQTINFSKHYKLSPTYLRCVKD